jgi:hypothetical protein
MITNERFMFAREVRAYSHGCRRVQDPAKYAEVLLNIARPSEHWTVEKVKQMLGRGEQDLHCNPRKFGCTLAIKARLSTITESCRSGVTCTISTVAR